MGTDFEGDPFSIEARRSLGCDMDKARQKCEFRRQLFRGSATRALPPAAGNFRSRGGGL